MNPTDLDNIRDLITRANNLIALLETLIASGRPSFAQSIVYNAAKLHLEVAVAVLSSIARELAIAEMQEAIGNDFNPAALDLNALLERIDLLPTIIDLQDNYGIKLIGTGGESLGVWLSSSGANLLLIASIFQAVDAAAQSLSVQVASWGAGYLSGLTASAYVESLRTASSAPAAFRLVAFDGVPLAVTLAPSSYAADALKLFGYLDGWNYAKFARRLIQLDHDIYEATYTAAMASRLWNSQNWLPTANALLRTDWTGVSGFANRSITSIDPVQSLAADSPYDLIVAYRARTTPCTSQQANALCHQNCFVQSVKDQTDGVETWAWAGTPKSNSFLPFLPKSIITGCVPARKSLARATLALWAEIGIYQNLEDIARFVNALEHGSIIQDSDTSSNATQARIDLMQFLHFIYYQTTINDRNVEYLAGMSSAILEFDNARDKVDNRTYIFLENLLKPVSQLPLGTAFANVVTNINWSSGDTSQYSLRMQNAVAAGAIRTFGSTEINALSASSFHDLVQRHQNQSEGWVVFISANLDWPDVGYNPADSTPQAPAGVFLMTIDQFNYAQGLQ